MTRKSTNCKTKYLYLARCEDGNSLILRNMDVTPRGMKASKSEPQKTSNPQLRDTNGMDGLRATNTARIATGGNCSDAGNPFLTKKKLRDIASWRETVDRSNRTFEVADSPLMTPMAGKRDSASTYDDYRSPPTVDRGASDEAWNQRRGRRDTAKQSRKYSTSVARCECDNADDAEDDVSTLKCCEIIPNTSCGDVNTSVIMTNRRCRFQSHDQGIYNPAHANTDICIKPNRNRESKYLRDERRIERNNDEHLSIKTCETAKQNEAAAPRSVCDNVLGRSRNLDIYSRRYDNVVKGKFGKMVHMRSLSNDLIHMLTIDDCCLIKYDYYKSAVAVSGDCRRDDRCGRCGSRFYPRCDVTCGDRCDDSYGDRCGYKCDEFHGGCDDRCNGRADNRYNEWDKGDNRRTSCTNCGLCSDQGRLVDEPLQSRLNYTQDTRRTEDFCEEEEQRGRRASSTFSAEHTAVDRGFSVLLRRPKARDKETHVIPSAQKRHSWVIRHKANVDQPASRNFRKMHATLRERIGERIEFKTRLRALPRRERELIKKDIMRYLSQSRCSDYSDAFIKQIKGM